MEFSLVWPAAPQPQKIDSLKQQTNQIQWIQWPSVCGLLLPSKRFIIQVEMFGQGSGLHYQILLGRDDFLLSSNLNLLDIFTIVCYVELYHFDTFHQMFCSIRRILGM
jgi:hypothetical protein